MSPSNALQRLTTQNTSLDRVARTVQRTEVAVAQREIERWGDLEILKIDVAARARAAELALDHDLELLERGMQHANGSHVAQELVLRYVEDQNHSFRRRIREVLDQ